MDDNQADADRLYKALRKLLQTIASNLEKLPEATAHANQAMRMHEEMNRGIETD
jgi:hypothetical protein